MRTLVRIVRLRIAGCLGIVLFTSAALAAGPGGSAAAQQGEEPTMSGIVPAPAEVRPAAGSAYRITSDTTVYTEPASASAAAVGKYLAGLLRPSTGYPLPVREARGSGTPHGVFLLLSGTGPRLDKQGYRMQVTKNAVVIRANKPAGLFAGVQTLRQLLPPSMEADSTQPGPWVVPGGGILDYPRFGYRGAMLDVARHFFTVDEVKRYIDLISMYKVNYLHLHLTDDQGWRIMIDSWPRLAKYGGGTEVGGGPGGYYTKAEYREIVRYAAERYITIVPEIDMPGHVNAALASYDKLNCDGTAPPLYTGTRVGFSSLCVNKEITYEFIDDVIREVAAMTPGPYLHIGGDEAHQTSPEDYASFMKRAQNIVREHGKTVRAWHQIADADMLPSAQPQYWGTTPDAPKVAAAARQGHDLVLSPASHAYLDMKYHEDTELGLDWAGYTSVKDSYSWDPGSFIDGADESSVLGVETPLWSETLENIDHVEFMAFPRLPAIAELGWSPAAAHDWDSARQRIASQGPRWDIMQVDYYRSPQVPWPRK